MAIFPANSYLWFILKDRTIAFHRLGKEYRIYPGDAFGIRTASSARDKIRVVTERHGITLVFSTDKARYTELRALATPRRP